MDGYLQHCVEWKMSCSVLKNPGVMATRWIYICTSQTNDIPNAVEAWISETNGICLYVTTYILCLAVVKLRSTSVSPTPVETVAPVWTDSTCLCASACPTTVVRSVTLTYVHYIFLLYYYTGHKIRKKKRFGMFSVLFNNDIWKCVTILAIRPQQTLTSISKIWI